MNPVIVIFVVELSVSTQMKFSVSVHSWKLYSKMSHTHKVFVSDKKY